MLSLMTPEKRVPANHPLRRVKDLAEACLNQLSPLFDAMYSNVGRSSIPPERLPKASLLTAFYSVRSERLFCEQTRLQHPVSLVPRHEHGRAELRSRDALSNLGHDRVTASLRCRGSCHGI
jgi:hypothetical protein